MEEGTLLIIITVIIIGLIFKDEPTNKKTKRY
jgi:hypothetical protein